MPRRPVYPEYRGNVENGWETESMADTEGINKVKESHRFPNMAVESRDLQKEEKAA